MTFTVTYREKSGAKAEVEIEAASRAACVVECKVRGIAPVGIREGRASSRPRAAETASPHDGRAGARPSSQRGLYVAVAVLCAAVLGGGLWLWLGREAPQPTPAEKPAKAKAERPKPPPRPAAKPAVTNAPPVATNRPPTKEEKRAAQLKAIRDKYGDNIPDNLKATVYFLENPPQRTFHPARTKAQIFKHQSERRIASLLAVEPGAFMLRKPTYDDRFDRDFAEALKDPIEMKDDDSQEDRDLKLAVADVKTELGERMAAGEKPSAILNGLTDSLYELGKYKRQLEQELTKIRLDPTYTDADIGDFVKAANTLLQEKGLAPVQMPNLVRRGLSIRMAAANRAKKEKKAEEAKAKQQK
jgi:hypothetical protein